MNSTTDLSVPYQGYFGCVTHPGLFCQNDDASSKRKPLSKIMTIKAFEEEIKNTRAIDGIDVNDNYHLRSIDACIPKITEEEYIVLKNQCTNPKDLQNLTIEDMRNKTRIVLMEDGGQTWWDFAVRKDLTLSNVKDFLISSYNAIRGVQHMFDRKFIHDDIKSTNLLYNINTTRSNIIDFGVSGFKNEIMQKKKQYPGDITWFDGYAPERHFQYMDQFDLARHALLSGSHFELTKYIQKFKNFSLKYYSLYCMFNENQNNNLENDIYELLIDLKSIKDHSQFLKYSLDYNDVYGIASALVQVTYFFVENVVKVALMQGNIRDMDEKSSIINLINCIRDLAIKATNIDSKKRMKPKEFAQAYEACILSNIKQPDIVYPCDVPTYIKKIIGLYPQNTFQYNPSSVDCGNWVKDSMLVSKHDDWLNLDLIEFLQNLIAFNKAKKNYDQVVMYLNNSHRSYALNIRTPQTNSRLSKKTDYVPSCLNLLGSRYMVTICYTDDDIFQNTNRSVTTPNIFIDKQNSIMYVEWKKGDEISHLDFFYSNQIPKPERPKVKNFNSIFFDNFELQVQNFFSKLDPEQGIICLTEMVCLALLEFYVPRSIVTGIRGIICDPQKETNQQIFQTKILSLIQTFNIDNNNREFQNALETRYNLSRIRGGIATHSRRLEAMKKLFNVKRNEIQHRNHAFVNQMINDQTNYNAMYKIYKVLNEAFAGMDTGDVAFVYRGYDITKGQVDNFDDYDQVLSDIRLRNTIDLFFSTHVVERINSNLNDVRVYSQVQVDAMLLVPPRFERELEDMKNHLTKNEKNMVYVVFEDWSKYTANTPMPNTDMFLVHGFRLRHDPIVNEKELVVLVPDACTFKVLEPVTLKFVNLLKLSTGAHHFTKETNDNLPSKIYSKGRMYVSMYESLYATELIANKQQFPQDHKKLFQNVNINWLNNVYVYILQQMFTG